MIAGCVCVRLCVFVHVCMHVSARESKLCGVLAVYCSGVY